MKKNLLPALAMLCMSHGAAAQTPQVTTDSRYVRGATWAFGRIARLQANGATIARQGFCYAEQPSPTIDDQVNSSTLSHEGTIYWLQDLKPATMYYMRAYATTTDGHTVYGDVIKFCTVPKGNVTYSLWRGSADDATYKRIDDAIKGACYYFNNMCYTTRDFDVAYSPGTPTADCNYTDRPHMNVGANTSYQRTGTIMHEMQHGLGLQNYSTQWCGNIMRSGDGRGYWLGDRVTEALHFWDNNTTSRLNGDNIHMWPYGVNGAHEDDGSQELYIANAMLCQALGEDGLEHNYQRFADPYYSLLQEDGEKLYLRCEAESRGRYTAFLMVTKTGSLRWVEMSDGEALKNDSAAWTTTFTPANQYYQLRNVATGRYLTYNGTAFTTVARTEPRESENLHLMPGRVDVDGLRGYWIIHPQEGWYPSCLQANANGATGSATFDLSNSAEAQRWLVETASQVEMMAVKAKESAQNKLGDLLRNVRALRNVAHTETVEGTDAALDAAIADIEQRSAGAETSADVQPLFAEARQAAMAFLRGAVPTRSTRPFVLTFLMQNPTLQDNAEGWSQQPGGVSYDCAEFYQQAFDFCQTVEELPAGTYQFTVKAFQRPGKSSECYANEVTAEVYAGDQAVAMAHIKAGERADELGGTEVAVGGKYIPNDMQAASLYFKKNNKYLNKVETDLTTDGGSLTVGLRCSDMPSSYWVIFSDITLNYLGDKTKTGISDVRAATASQAATYTLDGRRVETATQLRKGIYVSEGRKKVVK